MWKKGYPCRCRRCETRKTFRFKPDTYIREKRCPCGGTYRIDKFRLRREAKLYTCACDGYPFYHRRGSLYCREGYIGKRSNIPFHLRNYDEETCNEVDRLLRQREEEYRHAEAQAKIKHRGDGVGRNPQPRARTEAAAQRR